MDLAGRVLRNGAMAFAKDLDEKIRVSAAWQMVRAGTIYIDAGQLHKASAQAIEAAQIFGSDTAQPVRHAAEQLLYHVALGFRDAERLGEAVVLIKKVSATFGQDDDTEIRATAANAAAYAVKLLSGSDRMTEAVELGIEIRNAYKDEVAPSVRKQVDAALVNTGIHLKELGRFDESVSVLSEVAGSLVGWPTRDVVVTLPALFNLGTSLREAGRLEESHKVHLRLVRIFDRLDEQGEVQGLVSQSYVRAALDLDDLQRYEEARQACQDLIDRFQDVDDPTCARSVAQAYRLLYDDRD